MLPAFGDRSKIFSECQYMGLEYYEKRCCQSCNVSNDVMTL